MTTLDVINEDDIYVDITAPDPIPIKLVKKSERQPLIPIPKQFHLSVFQKVSIAFACGGITTVGLYYLIQFVIECTKNPYL